MARQGSIINRHGVGGIERDGEIERNKERLSARLPGLGPEAGATGDRYKYIIIIY